MMYLKFLYRKQEYLQLFPGNRRLAILATLRVEAEIYKLTSTQGRKH